MPSGDLSDADAGRRLRVGEERRLKNHPILNPFERVGIPDARRTESSVMESH
jgi:hypothetical protein